MNKGKVSAFIWSGDKTHLRGGVAGSGAQKYVVSVTLSRGAEGIVSGICTCPVSVNCKHVAALLVVARHAESEFPRDSSRGTNANTPRWKATISDLLPPAEPSRDDTVALALQVELKPSWPTSPPRRPGMAALPHVPTLTVRPLRQGKNGWVKSGANWSDLGDYRYSYQQQDFDEEQRRALSDLHDILVPQDNRYYLQAASSDVSVAAIADVGVWRVIDRLAAAGVPIVGPAPDRAPIRVEQADWRIDIRQTPTGLRLHPELLVDGVAIPHDRVAFIGAPAVGLYTWPETPSLSELGRVAPEIGRFSAAIPAGSMDYFRSKKVTVIPTADMGEFLGEYFLRFQKSFRWFSSDDSFRAPELPKPVLGLTLQDAPRHGLRGEWWVGYPLPAASHSADDVAVPSTRHPLYSRARSDEFRDVVAESRLPEAAVHLVADFPELREQTWATPRLSRRFALASQQNIRFLETALPALVESGVIVEIDPAIPNYRAATESPTIHLAGVGEGALAGDAGRGTGAGPGNGHDATHDWFDLVVTVTVGDEKVPFESLFIALAAGESTMILPSGLYFSLEDDRFDRLRALIDEARALQDSPSEAVRLSRYQADLWDDLAQLGIVDEQARAWREAAEALVPGDEIVHRDTPHGFTATLRSYQQQGYDWLTFLAEHRLGGILADDMGLGKTLQALAFVAGQRQNGSAPFLVVAPTSVVGNWCTEATKFTDLTVVPITQTRRKRGTSLTDVLAEAAGVAASVDVVVTSYTLFRLDFGEYQAVRWAGLLLDEAQFVKNRQSSGYQCARKLNAPVKIAITGTPLENNLMELWSLTSIVAPGLFPHPQRFTEYYAKPIERENNAERLNLLRRRVKPLMLRRTKEQVATDLPSKTEQVLEVDLAPSHRKLYDTYLNRERQKVLGLIDDMTANRFEVFRSLTLLRQASLDMSLVDPKHAKIPSAKLDVLDSLLADVVREGHRVLVFSQFTTFLGRARDRLDAAGTEYAYLDGKTRNRAAEIERFRADKVPVFFISLKAGGFGLNLTEADYCILLDPWWNPAAEAQAIDRTHRIGQSRSVMVYRLVSRGTIEEKVMALKATKLALFTSVLGDGAAGARGAAARGITADDIRELLS